MTLQLKLMTRKKIVRTLILFLVFNSTYLFGQDTCVFKIIDTLALKRAYYVIYEDFNEYNNTKYHYMSFFLKSKKDFKSMSQSMLLSDSISFYAPSQGLSTQLLLNKNRVKTAKDDSYEDVGDQIVIVKEKVSGQFTLYSIYSPLGFVRWELSKETYNNSKSIEQMMYDGEKQCLEVFSPVNYILSPQ
ncbi:MAG: hypothetical protein RLZZ577_1082 [Bacteroidota bacterium]|jgi:hypothetical protein